MRPEPLDLLRASPIAVVKGGFGDGASEGTVCGREKGFFKPLCQEDGIWSTVSSGSSHRDVGGAMMSMGLAENIVDE